MEEASPFYFFGNFIIVSLFFGEETMTGAEVSVCVCVLYGLLVNLLPIDTLRLKWSVVTDNRFVSARPFLSLPFLEKRRDEETGRE